MPRKTNNENIILLKKTKKDGSIPVEIVEEVASLLLDKRTVLLPVDNIYGLLSINENSIKKHAAGTAPQVTRLISSFKMLDELAEINKLQFDFLHRIWPGEVITLLENKNHKTTIPVRIPKSKYSQDIISKVDIPLYYTELYKNNNSLIYKKKEIIKTYAGSIDNLLIIDEFCKDHTPPTLIDITKGELEIIYEGRVSSEEIKSLYFLGKDDSVI